MNYIELQYSEFHHIFQFNEIKREGFRLLHTPIYIKILLLFYHLNKIITDTFLEFLNASILYRIIGSKYSIIENAMSRIIEYYSIISNA